MAIPYNATGLWPSANYGDAPKYASGVRGQVRISAADRDVLRQLAEGLAALASRPEETEKRELWRAHNSLQTKRPLLLVDPENGWNEIVTVGSLECAGEMARRWEMVLRKELFWGQSIRDDKPLEALFEVGYTYTDTEWGMEETYRGGSAGQSYVWEGAVHGPEDVAKIGMPKITVDQETTRETLALAHDVFGGILHVGLRAVWWWTLGMTYDLARLVGLEKMLYLLYDNPQMVHDIMAKLRDGYAAKIDFLEQNGLLSLNNNHAYVGSGGIGYSRELPRGPDGAQTVAAADTWCLFESQETIGISPDQFEEFVFQYQLPLQKRFGLICYGCCEPLDSRWHVVKKTPNLRRVSVSPWADQGKMAEFLQGDYVFSRKSPPSLLAVPRIEEGAVRADLRRTLELTRGCVLEIIMKDNHTLGGNPGNLVRWVQIAREEIERRSS
ncbi:MAG TPA: hypothetical protein VL354_10130 [Spirochaetia bacterium]|nr:hypothetical protein [Spirochaetia bacterium]